MSLKMMMPLVLVLAVPLLAGAEGPQPPRGGRGKPPSSLELLLKNQQELALTAEQAEISEITTARRASARIIRFMPVLSAVAVIALAFVGVMAVHGPVLDRARPQAVLHFLEQPQHVPVERVPQADPAVSEAMNDVELDALAVKQPDHAPAALGAQICATESCQVYSGVAKERAPHGEQWAAAVRQASGPSGAGTPAPVGRENTRGAHAVETQINIAIAGGRNRTIVAVYSRWMPVDPALLEILVCPVTRGPLEYDAEAGELISRQAGLAFPIRDGIPIMLVDEARQLTDDELAAN